MIQFTGYDLLWLFFIYSFAGWVLETAAATFMHRKFSTDRAMALFICIPVCSSYRVRRWKVN